MIFEKWSLNFDIIKLQEHLKKNILHKEISRQSSAFGGWSVLSGNGDIRDGWQKGHLLLKNDVNSEIQKEIRDQIKKKFSEYTIETEICTDYLLEVINKIRSFNLSPARARVICLTAGQSSIWHTDAPENVYAVRLHIPILTNEHCFFETKTEREHIPADGSAYFVYVNREHRVINGGDTDRFHLVIDVKDVDQVSQYHRLQDFRGKVE